MYGLDTSKEAINIDLALIKSCLRLINQTVILNKQRGETFSASENEELHKLISKIDKVLNKIMMNIHYDINIDC
ncbi:MULTISPECIES: phosphoglycerate mutase [Lysinibacillus]|uniref:Phosphoglycerate mutase n=1 Tax=Lysinibacillus irui TaxID=2998077 RepID=A0AAJ5UY78_9BACI|nr:MULTISPECIES: phosphoglycerate mutase [Lysinibacillus]WDV08725.1 phosphoglycerate mutase [Lysinibacillus irui]